MTEVYQVLKPEGTLVNGAKPAMETGAILEGLRWMMLSRAFDAKATALQRQGRFGTVSPVKGQEASAVGSSMAIDPTRDWLVPMYREMPAYIRQGYPLERLVANYMGKAKASRIPDDVKMVPNQVALSAQLLHAVGLAWGLKLQKKDSVVMTYCGEGSSSEGDFHEACNLAGVTRAPVVIWLQNNQWAISTSRAVQSAVEHFSDRAIGYGIAGRSVDGNDLLACYEVAVEAVERARSGGGPTLVEAITYRMSFHNTTDNPQKYLPAGWLEEQAKKDPIKRIQGFLAGQGLWDEAAESAMAGEIEEQLDAAVEAAAAMPVSRPADVFDNVYAELPPRVERQRRELLGE